MVYAPYTNGGEKEPEKIVVLWAGHLDPPAMGKHAREIVEEKFAKFSGELRDARENLCNTT